MNRILLAFLWVFSSPLVAQVSSVDSLKQRIEATSETVELVNLHRQIGFIYLDNQIEYDSAFYYAKKAQLIAKDSNLELQQAQTLFDQAMVMNVVGNKEKALDYYNQSLTFLLNIDTPSPKALQGIAIAYHNIGAIYGDLKQYAKAKEYYELSGTHGEKINMPLLRYGAYINISEIEIIEGKYAEAQEKLLKSISGYREIGEEEPSSYLLLARTYEKTEMVAEAINQSRSGLEIALKQRKLQEIYDINLFLSETYASEKLYKEAANHTKQALLYKDSIASEEVLNEVEKLELQMKIDEQESDLENLQQRNKYLMTIYFLVGLGVLLLTLLVFRQVKIGRMTKDIHSIQKRLIESELDRRSSKSKTAFDAAIAGDKEILKT